MRMLTSKADRSSQRGSPPFPGTGDPPASRGAGRAIRQRHAYCARGSRSSSRPRVHISRWRGWTVRDGEKKPRDDRQGGVVRDPLLEHYTNLVYLIERLIT